jgi:hypothetical protein
MASKRPKFAGLSDDQVLMLLGQIATTINLMADICRAEALRQSENDVALTFHTLETMLCGVGAMADHATGGDCVGDFTAWMVGPLFHPAQRIGGST